MAREPSVPLDQLIKSILNRAEPVEERRNLKRFLTNVILYIKRMEGAPLTAAEQNYPEHPQFGYYEIEQRPETVNGLRRRLEIIEQYKVTDVQRIMNIIIAASGSPSEQQLTTRKIQILLKLYQTPFIRQYELAAQLNTTAQTISKELEQLRNQINLSIVHHIDFHKFKLAHWLIYFRTKSLAASERLDKFYQRNPPGFLLRTGFDQDYRNGYIMYAIPDQPRAHRIFEERISWLHDEFFEENKQKRVSGLHVAISFDGYDPKSGTWMLEADTFAEAMLRFVRRHSDIIKPIHGIFYSEAMEFDKVDYLLANTSFGSGRIDHLKLKRDLLRRFGFDFATKTLWNRERKLHQNRVFFPAIYYEIPGFEEIVSLLIDCSSDTVETLRHFSSILPYTFILTMEQGIVFAFQRPAHCSNIIGQLVRVLSREEGVTNIDVLRLEPTFVPMRAAHNVNRWDESRQRWIIREGDI